MAEEEQNIDDLIDYKDFESNVESENEEDSFNDDILKIYEDHKKNFAANNKSTEIQNPQRPVSKYQRSHLSSNRNGDEERAILEIENKIEHFDEKLVQGDLEKFFLRFNKFILKNKIAKEDFLENDKLYLNLGDFKELFKKIRFEISSAELYHLFNFNNDLSKEGYILGKQFLTNFRNEIKFFDSSSVSVEEENVAKDNPSSIIELKEKNNKTPHDKQNNKNFTLSPNHDSKFINKEKNFLENAEKINTELFNKELKILKDEIFEIVQKNENSENQNIYFTNPKYKKSINRIKSSLPPGKRKFEDINMNMNNFTTNPNFKPPASDKTQNNLRPFSSTKSKPLTAVSIKNLIEEKSRKRKAEEEIIKLALEKRNKENERDCIKKMTEANQIAEKLGIMKSFTAYLDENEGLICRVFDKMERNVSDINIKKFLFEYKKLKKMCKQEEESKNLKSNLNNTNYDKIGNTSSHEDNLFNLNRENRQRIIKDILLNSLELKIQLKTQLRILRNKNLIDPSIINSTLKLNNLDDDNVSLNLQNIDFSYSLNSGY